MPTHAWAEHVVLVELYSSDADVVRTTAHLLEQRFAARDVEVLVGGNELQVHSELDRPVPAAEVAQLLAETGVRARAVHERHQWSVVDVDGRAG